MKKILDSPSEVYKIIKKRGKDWERLYKKNETWILFLKEKKLEEKIRSDPKEKQQPHATYS